MPPPVDDVIASPRLPALDGLRALAIALVLVGHTYVSDDVPTNFTHFGSGWRDPAPAGVRLFFVLSGFLITGILVRARAGADHRLAVWRAFMLRRMLRIVPLAFVALGVAWCLGDAEMRAHPFLYLGFLSNFSTSILGYGRSWLTGHFWSLAIEEQFYLVWPVVMLFLPVRALKPALLGLLVAVCSGRAVEILYWSLHRGLEWGPYTAYVTTWSRLDALAAGGLLAVSQPALWVVGMVAASLGGLTMLVPARSPLHLSLSESAMVAVSCVVVLASARGWGARVLTWRPLVFLGTISYGLYVWHPFVLHVLPPLFGMPVPAPHGAGLLALVSGGSVAVAAASWFAFERRLNTLKRFVPYRGSATTDRPKTPHGIVGAPAR